MCGTQYTPTATIVSSCCQLSPRTFTFSPGEENVTIFCQFNLCITTSPDLKKEKIKLAGDKPNSNHFLPFSVPYATKSILLLHCIISTAQLICRAPICFIDIECAIILFLVVLYFLCDNLRPISAENLGKESITA